MRLSLTVSTAGHAAALGALLVLAHTLTPPVVRAPPKKIEIALNQPEARIETVRPVAPESEPVLKPVETEPERPVTAVAPPPPPKRIVRPPVKPLPRAATPAPQPEPEPAPAEIAPTPRLPPAPAAYVPAPRPDLEAGYRASLSRWLESHKRYPSSARESGEEGSAVVRFRVDASGRVLDFTLVRGTRYPDLDRAVTDMLNGAQMPPFPPGLTLTSLDVAVTLRFSLTR